MDQVLKLDILIEGDGIKIKKEGILPPPGKDRLRLKGDGPIGEWALTTVLLGNNLDVEAHTWDEEGHHLDLFSASLDAEEEVKGEVTTSLGGKQVKLCYLAQFHA